MSDIQQTQLLALLKATPLEGRPGAVEALYVAHFGDVAYGDHMLNGGVVILETGRVFGGDSGYYYTGTYSIKDGDFKGELTIERHNPLWHSAWGDEDEQFKIRVAGTRKNEGAIIEGKMERIDRPGQTIGFRLIRRTSLP